MSRSIKVASIQAAPIGYDLDATLDKVEGLVKEAASQGVQLAVLPEAFLSAYPRHTGGYYVGSRSDEQREWFARYVRSAVRVPEDAVGRDYVASSHQQADKEDYTALTRLCEIAKQASIYVSIGIVERSIVGSTLYCTNLVISPSGILLSKHRKLQPTAAERVVWSQGEARYPVKAREPSSGSGKADSAEVAHARESAGDNLPVARTEIGRIGGLICWENFMPLARYALYEKGVEIYTAPTADARPTWLPSMQHIAQEGRCFVISANQVHGAKDFPSDYPAVVPATTTPKDADDIDKKEQLWSRGGSCIVGPLGQVLAGPLWDQEGILYAELDLDTLDGARLDFDPVGHYARAELMKSVILHQAH